MVLALPRTHPQATRKRPLALASLSDIEWVAASADTAFGDMFVRVCRAVGGLEPRIRHRVNEMQLLLDIVASGAAAALVPALGRPDSDPASRSDSSPRARSPGRCSSPSEPAIDGGRRRKQSSRRCPPREAH
jgi:DNA-binding transcriptional LysR family regulator